MFLNKFIRFTVKKIISNLNHGCKIKSIIIKPNVRSISASKTLMFLEVRDKDHEEKSKQLIVHQGEYFDRFAAKEKNKETFKRAVSLFIKRNAVYRRGHVEFLYAAIDKMVDFHSNRDIDCYRALFDIFPKKIMTPRNVWQIEFMHYPKQQQCCIDILDYMESNGVTPDDEMGYQLRDVFGDKSHAFRKYRRMMYWMPKFKYANPYYVPFDLPEGDPTALAKMALKRMNVDLETKIDSFQTKELDPSTTSDTFVVSAQSVEQQRLIDSLNAEEPLFVEGRFKTWLRHKSVNYFVLKSNDTSRYYNFLTRRKRMIAELPDEAFKLYTYNSSDTLSSDNNLPTPATGQHEQEDGIILGMCVTGTASKDSLTGWIRYLERTNPKLSRIPVVFQLKSKMDDDGDDDMALLREGGRGDVSGVKG